VAVILPVHGGDLLAAEARWGKPAAGWLDLSTGINPWAYPVPPLSPDIWGRLPGRAEDQAARDAAARAYGCRPEQVLAAAGSSALIQALAFAHPAAAVTVVGPTYCEHARAWAAAGHCVTEAGDLPESGDVVVVVNPNNPDGRRVDPGRLRSLAPRCRLLVVDEAFADVAPGLSVAADVSDRLVVLRSFGKFYGLAGLRLGFALGGPGLIAGLRARLGPWPVSGPALAIAVQALCDDGWAAAGRSRLAGMAVRLDTVLAECGLAVAGGTDLFRLAAHPRAAALHDQLGRAGILVRAFADRPGMLRFGLPGDDPSLCRLRDGLAEGPFRPRRADQMQQGVGPA